MDLLIDYGSLARWRSRNGDGHLVFGHDLHRAVLEDVDDPAAHGLLAAELDEDLIAGSPTGLGLVHAASIGAVRERSRAR